MYHHAAERHEDGAQQAGCNALQHGQAKTCNLVRLQQCHCALALQLHAAAHSCWLCTNAVLLQLADISKHAAPASCCALLAP
jgi:hypothetical protein